jgi:hypothetical protein
MVVDAPLISVTLVEPSCLFFGCTAVHTIEYYLRLPVQRQLLIVIGITVDY